MHYFINPTQYINGVASTASSFDRWGDWGGSTWPGHPHYQVQSRDVTHADWCQNLSPDHHLTQDCKSISHQALSENLLKPSTQLVLTPGPTLGLITFWEYTCRKCDKKKGHRPTPILYPGALSNPHKVLPGGDWLYPCLFLLRRQGLRVGAPIRYDDFIKE